MLASYMDSTNLKPAANREEIRILCERAAFLNMAAVCVNPVRAALAGSILQGSGVGVSTVIGFPLGAAPVRNKVHEAVQALEDGATELDVVINIGAVKDQEYKVLAQEINQMLTLKNDYKYLLKVIVETALLTEKELIELVKIVSQSGADYIKTSTGFASRGVNMEDIRIINGYKSPELKIKASGGIKTLDFALQLIAEGVDRIGSSSAEEFVQAYRLQFKVYTE